VTFCGKLKTAVGPFLVLGNLFEHFYQSRFFPRGGVFFNDPAFGGFIYRLVGGGNEFLRFIFFSGGQQFFDLFGVVLDRFGASQIPDPVLFALSQGFSG